MSPYQRDATQHAKARQRRYRKAQERLARDRRQAQKAAEALQQALEDLGLPEDLVTEIEGRLRSQKKLLSKIVGMMCPPLFGCRTNVELCRVRGWDKNLPSRLIGVLPKRSWLKRLRRLGLDLLFLSKKMINKINHNNREIHVARLQQSLHPPDKRFIIPIIIDGSNISHDLNMLNGIKTTDKNWFDKLLRSIAPLHIKKPI